MYASILVALDGSDSAHAAGRIALGAARELGCGVLGTHVYAAELHSERFRAMEPGLPPESQGEETLGRLRETHDSFISDGLHALSRGYLEQFLSEARSAGVAAEEIHLEGRNYVRLLELARERGVDLIALGARGLGAIDDDLLGSTAARVLRQAPCDVLIARRPLAGGGIVAGIDGSDYAQAIVRKAAVWARVSGGKLRLAAAYDPAFHVHVFETMARSLAPERQEEVGLQKQEALHEGLINDGLAALYRGFLDRAFQGLGSDGCPAERVLLEGKAYRALAEHAEGSGADLIVVGRFGHHREESEQIGSNAEALARAAGTNVLITAPDASARSPQQASPEALEWDAEALARLERVPAFARPMARRGVEAHVQSRGGARVTLEAFLEVARSMGMGGPAEEERGG